MKPASALNAICLKQRASYNSQMVRFLLRWFFHRNSRGTAGREEDRVVSSLPHSRVRTRKTSVKHEDTRPPNTAKIGETFDEATAHPVKLPVVLEGPAYVTDGDTITILRTQVRLFGIDAPELNHPHGKKAKWALVRLCKGHLVRAEITAEDEYGRTVAKCSLPDGRDLSEEMVKQGLAIDWPKYSGGKYRQLEVPGVRKKLWLADARQKGQMHVWGNFNARQKKLNKSE